MMDGLNPASGAIPLPLRIRFYIDGWNSFLFAEEAAGVSRYLIEEGLQAFRDDHSTLFDFDLPPVKRAQFVASCLREVTDSIVSMQEEVLRKAKVDVLTRSDALLMIGGYQPPRLFKDIEPKTIVTQGRTYFSVKIDGIVFCPRFEAKVLKKQLSKRLQEVRQRRPADKYKHVINQLERAQSAIDRGMYDESQKYYSALGRELGQASRKGYLIASTDTGSRIITEKAVDGDMQTRITADAYTDAADVFVLMTNDGDHYPAAEEAKKLGKTVYVVRHSGEAARAMKDAVGAENIIRFYDQKLSDYVGHQLNFDPIWLRIQDERSLQILDDMRMQYAWWEANGEIARPAFPPTAQQQKN